MSYIDNGQIQSVPYVKAKSVADVVDYAAASGRTEHGVYAISDTQDIVVVRDRVRSTGAPNNSAVYTTLSGAFGRYSKLRGLWVSDKVIVSDNNMRIQGQASVQAEVEWRLGVGGREVRPAKAFVDSDAPVVLGIGPYSYPIDRSGYVGRGAVVDGSVLKVRTSEYNTIRTVCLSVTQTGRFRRR